MRASLSWSLSFFRDKKSYACVGQSFETIMARYLSLCVSSTRPHHCPQGVNLWTELPQDSEVQMFEATLFSVLVGDVALPALSQNRSPKPSVFTAGRSTQSGMRWSFSTSASMFLHLFMYQILPLYLWGFQDKRSNSNIFESMNTQNWSMFLLSHPILVGNHRWSHICLKHSSHLTKLSKVSIAPRAAHRHLRQLFVNSNCLRETRPSRHHTTAGFVQLSNAINLINIQNLGWLTLAVFENHLFWFNKKWKLMKLIYDITSSFIGNTTPPWKCPWCAVWCRHPSWQRHQEEPQSIVDIREFIFYGLTIPIASTAKILHQSMTAMSCTFSTLKSHRPQALRALSFKLFVVAAVGSHLAHTKSTKYRQCQVTGGHPWPRRCCKHGRDSYDRGLIRAEMNKWLLRQRSLSTCAK